MSWLMKKYDNVTCAESSSILIIVAHTPAVYHIKLLLAIIAMHTISPSL